MDNSAACLFHDGQLVAAIENERLTRVKNDDRIPIEAIRECLEIAGITMEDVTQIAVYWQPWRVTTRLRGVLGKMATSSMARQAVAARTRAMFLRDRQAEHPSGRWSDLFQLRRVLRREFGPVRARLSFHDHHLTHQLYAEAMRDWDEFASLAYDGGGETASSVVSTVRGGQRSEVSRHYWPNSLGHFYSVFTAYLGFRMLEGEYKMMGLAPLGEPVFAEALQREVLRLAPGGTYRLNTEICDYHAALRGQFHPRLEALFGAPRGADEEPLQRHIDLAASVQHVFELAQQHLLEPVSTARSGLRHLVISGGCALNVTANGRLLEKGMFEQIIIPPAPHDAGCAIGAAMAALLRRGVSVDPRPLRSPYLGTEYSSTRLAEVVTASCHEGVALLGEAELVERVAQLLAEGKVVAWFQGRSEFGPRALGNRSFLADPRNEEIREELNAKIKKRELFRPFAPSVIEEAAPDFFEIDQPSPYMNIVARVRAAAQAQIPAVTHVDGTARVHTVSAEANPLYHALISRFGALTGVPVLLNTSFNIQEPIVQTPEEAMATFRASGVDVLVLGRFLILRENLV